MALCFHCVIFCGKEETGKGERHIKDSPPFRPRQLLSSSGEGTPTLAHPPDVFLPCRARSQVKRQLRLLLFPLLTLSRQRHLPSGLGERFIVLRLMQCDSEPLFRLLYILSPSVRGQQAFARRHKSILHKRHAAPLR